MVVSQIIRTGSKTFNKAGYRLVAVEKLAMTKKAQEAGAATIKRATIEHINGEKKIVESWLGENEKTIKSIHRSTHTPNEATVTTYKWSQPKTYEPNNPYHNYLKKDNPYVFENITGRINRSTMVRPNAETSFTIQKSVFTNLDINASNRTVTKSLGTVNGNINTSEIYSIQNGKKVKGIYLQAERQQNGLYKTVNKNYFGISSVDANQVFADEYFHSRFLPNTVMAKCCVAQAGKNQGLSYVPKLFRSPYPHNSYADNSKKGIGLAENILENSTFNAEVIDTLNHETKHLQQRELIEKYFKGELTHSKDKTLAMQYKNNFDNYITPFENEEKYLKQLIEKEARTTGREAFHKYFETTDKLKSLFKFSSFHSIGA